MLYQQVIKKLRCRFDTSYKEMVPRTRAGYVKQVPLGIIDFLEIGVIAYGFDAFLQGNHLIIAGHDDDYAEL